MITVREERMADFFLKTHVDGLRVPAVFHRFTAVDTGDPHTHPWPFTSFIVSGGYVERVYQRDGSNDLVYRKPGDSFRIAATHIHRIVELPEGECETLILPGPPEQKSGFWQFRDDGAYHRFWDQTEWTKA